MIARFGRIFGIPYGPDSMEYEWFNPLASDSAWLLTAEAGTVLAVGPDGKPGHYYAGI